MSYSIPADESAVSVDISPLKRACQRASARFHLLSRMLEHPAPARIATELKKILLVLFFTATLHNYSTAAILLEMGASARAVALGGALLAIADDENALFYNPAGLAVLERPVVSVFYDRVFEVVHHFGVVAAVRGLGAQLLQLDTGAGEGANEFGNPSGAEARFFNRLGLLGLALGGENFSLGGRLQLQQTPTAAQFGLDAAARLAVGALRFGLLLQGAPLELRLGTALVLRLDPHWSLSAALDVWRIFTAPELHLGLEVTVDSLRMRLGYDGVALASGAGVRWKRLQLDWAYRIHPHLPASTIVTIAYLF